MAQIASRKTADQAKGLHPEAAQVLKNNTYMDDICDSLHSVQQAKQLTTEQDQVLLKGGFSNQGMALEPVFVEWNYQTREL